MLQAGHPLGSGCDVVHTFHRLAFALCLLAAKASLMMGPSGSSGGRGGGGASGPGGAIAATYTYTRRQKLVQINPIYNRYARAAVI